MSETLKLHAEQTTMALDYRHPWATSAHACRSRGLAAVSRLPTRPPRSSAAEYAEDKVAESIALVLARLRPYRSTQTVPNTAQSAASHILTLLANADAPSFTGRS